MLTRLLPTSKLPKSRLALLLCTTTLFASSCMQEREAQQAIAPSQQETIVAQDTLAKAKVKPDTTAIVAQIAADTSRIQPGPKPLPGANRAWTGAGPAR